VSRYFDGEKKVWHLDHYRSLESCEQDVTKGIYFIVGHPRGGGLPETIVGGLTSHEAFRFLKRSLVGGPFYPTEFRDFEDADD
jgi:hypothetical protein